MFESYPTASVGPASLNSTAANGPLDATDLVPGIVAPSVVGGVTLPPVAQPVPTSHSDNSAALMKRRAMELHLDENLHTHATDLVGLLRERVELRPHQRAFTFLTDGDSIREHITYTQLDTQARLIAAHLQQQGLQGERALLLYPSGLEFIAAFFGCLYAGVTAVPAYPPRRNRNLARIQSIVQDATPGIALTTHSVFDRVEPMIGDVEDLKSLPWQCTDDLDLSLADKWSDPEIDPDTLAFLQYTSGSTGTPKGVMLSHGNLLHNTTIISEGFSPSRPGEGVTWLPLYHDMGLIGGIIQPIMFCRAITLMTPTHFLQKPIRWLKALSDSGAIISGGPNFAYELCVERITDEEKKTLDLSQWEVAFNGAEPVRKETLERFAKAFAPCGFRPEAFYPCYGLAEGTLMVAGGERATRPTTRKFDSEALKEGRGQVSSDDENALPIVSTGRSLMGQEIAIADPETCEPLADGQIGEIWVCGPSVAQGYWKRPEVSKEVFEARLTDGRGPFLRTGDLGFFDQGELFVAGRLKDLIIIRGANHYPQDIEQTVEQAHDSVPPSSGAAIATGDAGAERLVVIQEMGRQRNLPFEEIFAAIRSQIVKLHDVAPQAIVMIRPASIPKTSSGKIRRNACREAYEAGELSIVAEWNAEDGVKLHRKRRARANANPDGELLDAPDQTTQATASTKTNGKAPATKAKPEPAANKPTTNVGAQSVEERVLGIIREIAKERAKGLTRETDIAGMGLDSLERMEIVASLEDEFGGRFPEEAIMAMETCGDVIQAVETNLGVGEAKAAEHELTEADYVFAKSIEYKKLLDNFRLAEMTGVKNPYFTRHEGITNDRTTINGKEYINWCSYNYLGMSGDAAVTEASQEALQQFGSSVSASRVVSGEKTLHHDLEKSIAEFIGTEDAIVLVGGHATNETVIGHLFGAGDLILHDALSHNSIVQGCRLSGAHRRAFPHNDHEACRVLLERYRSEYRRVLIVVEGVYSMDGDYSPVPEFVELKKKHKAYLMVDEAHSMGTMGKTGRGMSEHYDVSPQDVDIWMGTMSKSLGSCGGYIAANKEIVEYLKYTAPGFVYSVGLSPPNAAAALTSLQLLEAEPERVTQLRENSRLFLQLAKQAGLNTGMSGETPIIPVITGNSLMALQLADALFQKGINVQPIMYPAVEEAAARLRFFITSTHTEEQIRQTVKVLSIEWEKLQTAGSIAPATPVEASLEVVPENA